MGIDTNTSLHVVQGDRFTLNKNAIIREGREGVTVSLPYYGHQLQGSSALGAVLSAIRERADDLITGAIEHDVINLLEETYVILRSDECDALSGGLTHPAHSPVGTSYSPREICNLEAGSICLFGAPVDTAVLPPFSPAHGPMCIRREIAGLNLSGAFPALTDLGDIVRWPDDGLSVVGARIEHLISRILKAGCMPLMLGGDHATSYYSLRAVARRRKPLSILHLDAHDDLGTSSLGARPRSPLNHANVLAYAFDLSELNTVVQVGVRKPPSSDQAGFGGGKVLATVGSARLRRMGADAVITMLPNTPLYLSVDLDVVDPQFAPEVTTPLGGGIDVAELHSLVASALARREVVGLDLVEVCAVPGAINRAALIAAELVSLIAAKWGPN